MMESTIEVRASCRSVIGCPFSCAPRLEARDGGRHGQRHRRLDVEIFPGFSGGHPSLRRVTVHPDHPHDISGKPCLGRVHPCQKVLRRHGPPPTLGEGRQPCCNKAGFPPRSPVVNDVGYQRHHRDDLENEGDVLNFHPFFSCAGRDHPAPSAHPFYALLFALTQAKNAY